MPKDAVERVSRRDRSGRVMAFRLLPLLALAVMVSGCSQSSTTTTPAPPQQRPTSITFAGTSPTFVCCGFGAGYFVSLWATATPSQGNGRQAASTQLTAIARLSDGTQQNVTFTATWTSSNTAVATVSSTGLVTAVVAGTTTITATFQGTPNTITVVVTTTPVTSVVITGTTLLTIGQTSQLTATAFLADGTTQNVTNATAWSWDFTINQGCLTSNPTFNTSATGLVTAISGSGSNFVTAVYQGVEGVLRVCVLSCVPAC